MEDFIGFLALVGVGIIAGALNAMAAGGSFLTLPVLILLGLPPSVANGTNRLAVGFQSLTSLWEFQRWAQVDWRLAGVATIPAVVGSVLGAWAALAVGDQAFKHILSMLMLAVAVGTLWNPFTEKTEKTSRSATHGVRYGVIHMLLFFLVGVYGGFIQAGVGFLLLAVTTFSGLNLTQGNAIKVFNVLLFTAVSLIFFAWNGKIDWRIGFALSLGTAFGGVLGARLSFHLGDSWMKRLVTAVILVFALALWAQK